MGGGLLTQSLSVFALLSQGFEDTIKHLRCANARPFCVTNWALFRQFQAICLALFRWLVISGNFRQFYDFFSNFRQFSAISGNFWHFGGQSPRKKPDLINKEKAEDCTPKTPLFFSLPFKGDQGGVPATTERITDLSILSRVDVVERVALYARSAAIPARTTLSLIAPRPSIWEVLDGVGVDLYPEGRN